ncbi:hypothetical protein Clacol_003012 [Clathrus columnatus]|uniref:Carboxylic ester hydrolase n=1 Tax=Clathrus columnatus TaxID=1419009 RepID=A0AAV5A5Q1_9AGAM|nr:hypothetical protein Clacol_003012 [Clathrus columnatus]
MTALLYAVLLLLRCISPVHSSGTPSPSSLGTSLTLLRQNDLNYTDANNHASTILLESMTFDEAASKCASLNENLVNIDAAPKFSQDLTSLLSYLDYRDTYPPGQAFWIGNQNSREPKIVQLINGKLIQSSILFGHLVKLPALCSQSAPFRPASDSDKNPDWQVTVSSNSKTFTGFRDQLSFRFLGLPYANPPARWEYSTLYNNKSVTHIDATNYGSQCWQSGSGPYSEDCLFLNVFTPFLPGSSDKKNLKPVLFWIHGGSFTSGTGADPTFDGGALASRGDVVVVTINYRLTTLGFLALDDGTIKGNFGLADQIVALEWVQQNIAAFGGDPNRVTIFGQSAGAGSVRALLASPPAKGKFAAAVPMSNLAGADYATTYSLYYTQTQEVQVAANAIIKEVNCSNASDVVSCLRAVPPSTFINIPDEARYLVVDGTYLITDQLELNGSSFTNNVPTMWGHMRFDGAALIGYPTPNQDLTVALQPIINTQSAAAVARPDLFPIPDGPNATLNIFNVTARIATDVEFRCLDQATALAAVKNKIFSSTQTPGSDPNAPVCDAPKTPEFPNGDPNLPYFQCHSGELYYVFGSLGQFDLPFRDDNDVYMSQVSMDRWVSFAWTHNPNPSKDLLIARNYQVTLDKLQKDGTWEPVNAEKPTLHVMDYPGGSQIPFEEQEQCDFLNFPFSFYE